jgi:uncharacterized protein (TIGR00730 family)
VNVCVFCGANAGASPAYAAAARALGRGLVERGYGLVFGGGSVGLMGVVADAVLDAGGEAIGVIPRALVERELAHQRATQMHVVSSMHDRKQLMHDLAGAFVAMPGGLGTLDETFEALTWLQLGVHRKPVGLLDVEGYYEPLLTWLERARADGFVPGQCADKLLVAKEPGALLDALAEWQAPDTPRWVGVDER